MSATVSNLKVWYTADTVTSDGSDTDGYGDGCEPGHGYTMAGGWADLRWDGGRTVYDNQEDVRPDEWTPADGPQIDWLIGRILDTVGAPEDCGTQADGTYYATDADQSRDGIEISVAAHIHGASPAVLTAVAYGVRHQARAHWH